MRRSIIVVLVSAAGAFAFTIPLTNPYDGLLTYDHFAGPLTAGALHINGGVGYATASAYFDDDGNSQDYDQNPTLLAVPIDLGYAIDERWMADITVQILNPKQGDADNFGVGDMWAKFRGIWEVGPDFYLGPRVGVKVNTGKWKDLDVNQLPLGDGFMDVDFGAVATMAGTEKLFKANGALGVRYRLKYTDTILIPDPNNPLQWIETDIDITPGMLIYADLEPGIGFGPDQKFQAYLPINYVVTMKDKMELPDYPNIDLSDYEYAHNTLFVGLHPKYVIDENTTVGLKFLYTVMGKNIDQGMLIGATCDAFIPF